MKHKPSKQTWQEFEIGVIGLSVLLLGLFLWNSWANLGKNNVGHLTKAYSMEVDEQLTFNPELPEIDIALKPADYKTLRLQEMANEWKGTVLEKHTVPLLAMLLVEDGTITAERRHDCAKERGVKVCYAIGMQGHHICHRGTPLVYQDIGEAAKTFCTWKDGKSPQQQFEAEYPSFATEWRLQFQEYTLRMTACIESRKTVNQCIQAWNSREAGRLDKVARLKPFVHDAIF